MIRTRDPTAAAAAELAYKEFLATSEAARIQKAARTKKWNIQKQKTNFEVAKQAEIMHATAAAAAAIVPGAPIVAAPTQSSDRLITVFNFYGNIREFPHFWALVVKINIFIGGI